MELPVHLVGRRSTFGHRINFVVSQANSILGIRRHANYLALRRLFQTERFRYPWDVSQPGFLRKTGAIRLLGFRQLDVFSPFFLAAFVLIDRDPVFHVT